MLLGGRGTSLLRLQLSGPGFGIEIDCVRWILWRRIGRLPWGLLVGFRIKYVGGEVGGNQLVHTNGNSHFD